MCGVGLFMHAMRCSKSRVHIAPMESNLVRDVVSAIVQWRRIRVQRLLRTQDRHILFVCDPNQIQCVTGYFFAHRRNGRHLLTGKTNSSFGQDMTVFMGNSPARRWGVIAGDDSLDARQCQGCRCVNGDNARTGVRTAQHLAKQHAWQLDVTRVGGTPEHLGACIDLRRIPTQCRFTHGGFPERT